MIAFQVKDMTSGHCASNITQSLKATDPDAKVTIDIGKQVVMIEAAPANGDELREAIVDAGYTPAAVEVKAMYAHATGRSCCGHCR